MGPVGKLLGIYGDSVHRSRRTWLNLAKWLNAERGLGAARGHRARRGTIYLNDGSKNSASAVCRFVSDGLHAGEACSPGKKCSTRGSCNARWFPVINGELCVEYRDVGIACRASGEAVLSAAEDPGHRPQRTLDCPSWIRDVAAAGAPATSGASRGSRDVFPERFVFPSPWSRWVARRGVREKHPVSHTDNAEWCRGREGQRC